MSESKKKKSEDNTYRLFGITFGETEIPEENPLILTLSSTQFKRLKEAKWVENDALCKMLRKHAEITFKSITDEDIKDKDIKDTDIIFKKITADLKSNSDDSATLTVKLVDNSLLPQERPRHLKRWLKNFRHDFELFFGCEEQVSPKTTSALVAALGLESKEDASPILIISRHSKLLFAFHDRLFRDYVASTVTFCIPRKRRFTIDDCGFTHTHFFLTSIPEGRTAEDYVAELTKQVSAENLSIIGTGKFSALADGTDINIVSTSPRSLFSPYPAWLFFYIHVLRKYAIATNSKIGVDYSDKLKNYALRIHSYNSDISIKHWLLGFDINWGVILNGSEFSAQHRELTTRLAKAISTVTEKDLTDESTFLPLLIKEKNKMLYIAFRNTRDPIFYGNHACNARNKIRKVLFIPENGAVDIEDDPVWFYGLLIPIPDDTTTEQFVESLVDWLQANKQYEEKKKKELQAAKTTDTKAARPSTSSNPSNLTSMSMSAATNTKTSVISSELTKKIEQLYYYSPDIIPPPNSVSVSVSASASASASTSATTSTPAPSTRKI